MLQLNNLESLTKKRKRIGRGGSRGGTSGKGHKGQKARSGGQRAVKHFFEGGQMPLVRRLPKRGFTNVFKREFILVNLRDLEARFNAGEVVDNESLRSKGFIKTNGKFFVKVLGTGTLTKNLTVKADAFSQTAVQAIEKANGKIELNGEKARGSVAS